MNGEVVKTVPSNLDAEHLHQLKLRGARPAGPPPALPAVDRVGDLPSHQVLEVERTVDPNGWINLAGQRVKIGSELANRVITVRLDGHLLHAVHDGLLAKTLPSPFTAGERPRLVGARVSATQLPPAPAAVSVERKVPTDGVVMWPASACASDAPMRAGSSLSTSRTPTSASPTKAPRSRCTPARTSTR